MEGRELVRVVVGNSTVGEEADSSTPLVAVDRQPAVAVTRRTVPRAEEDNRVQAVAPPGLLRRAVGMCIAVVEERI
jgi:hypothetical protein